ncbi:MAG: corrinoid protein [Firmicutes bacterium]|nr:corrinoid protein [Bacillota bacterium]MBR3786858.1 corrinoid protein [Bacillota bacterium]MBR6799116.1 corrinoid protein [Bacillota bacterium]
MDIYELMKEAVLDGDEEEAVRLAEQALEEGLELQKVMDDGFLAGIQEAGQLYEDEEYFLPDLVCSADAMKCALEVLDEAMKNDPNAQKGAAAKVALVTVQGDVHDIGKTIVGAMMTASGFEVYDLGTDVLNEDVIAKVKEIDPDVLGLSALLTTTMEEQGNIIEMLKAEGLRDDVKVIIGGAPVNQAWADKITADGYSDNAIAAVKLAQTLLA